MSIISLEKVLDYAEKNNFAVGAFNVNNLEMIEAVVRAAEEENAPVILMYYYSVVDNYGSYQTAMLARGIAEKARVPVVIHLDHSTEIAQTIKCAHAGFTSVMFDGSKLPLAENIRKTNEVSKIVKLFDVNIEAELGYVGLASDDNHFNSNNMTNPEEVREFTEQTNIDALAVAIGNAHGIYREKPELDIDRLKEIHSLTDIPLVLHGGTGIPEDDIRKAIENGIRKINVGTQLFRSLDRGFKDCFEKDPDNFSFSKGIKKAQELIRDIVKEKIRLFGSSNKNWL